MYRQLKKIPLFLTYLLFCGVFGYAQNNNSLSNEGISDIGLFPKIEAPQLYTFKINGEYRFLGTYTHLNEPYGFNKENTLFIGDDSQMPSLTLRISGRPSKRTSWGFDLYTYQFMHGDIKPAYGFMVAEIDRPNLYDPINGNRLASSLIVHLGINLYASFDTKVGSFLLKAGGIHWTSMSDLTLASFKGYNRFSLFERAPWDPIQADVESRYYNFFKRGNISQDARWGEKAFTGLLIEGSNLPADMSFKGLFGKTDLYGGFLKIPNIAYGGQLRKKFDSGAFIGVNTFNNLTYKDSLNTETIGFNIATVESNFQLAKFGVKLETGLGRYVAPNASGDWGEAIHAKIKTPRIKDKFTLETHIFSISPKVINNNSIFMNTAIHEESNNELPAGSIGSTQALMPFASSMVPLGMMTNNRYGINVNAELDLKNLKLSVGIGSSAEIDAISNKITYGHPINGLTRSRFWRWNFPANVGPYERYSVTYRNVYETVNLVDSVVQQKYFNGIEFQAKYHPDFFARKLYIFGLSRISTTQNFLSGLPVFTEQAYIRQYSNELEAYFALNSNMVLNGYAGVERTIANYDTEIDVDSKRPRNQFGHGYGLGIDYTIAKNTALFIRHRWFKFEDKNFDLDKFKGTETILELKITF